MQSHLDKFNVSDLSTFDKLTQLVSNLSEIKRKLQSDNALTVKLAIEFDFAISDCRQKIMLLGKSAISPRSSIDYGETIRKCEKLLDAYIQSESSLWYSGSFVTPTAAALERKSPPISTSQIKLKLNHPSKSALEDTEELRKMLTSTTMQPRAVEKMPSVDKKEQPAAGTVTNATTITASTPKPESSEELISISLWQEYGNISLKKLNRLEQELLAKRDDINKKLDIIAKVKDERIKGHVEMQAQTQVQASLSTLLHSKK